MEKQLCSICGHRHNLNEPHIFDGEKKSIVSKGQNTKKPFNEGTTPFPKFEAMIGTEAVEKIGAKVFNDMIKKYDRNEAHKKYMKTYIPKWRQRRATAKEEK